MKSALHVLMILILCGLAQAYVITFEDLTLNDTYHIGDNLMSNGVQITAAEYDPGANAYAVVQAGGDAGATGNEMRLNNIALDFDFAMHPLHSLALQYGETGGNVILEVNGDLRNVLELPELNGLVIGGVMVTVVDGGTTGAIFATGAIDSFSIGGNELAVDNIIACVPEPATIVLLGFGSVLLLKRV